MESRLYRIVREKVQLEVLKMETGNEDLRLLVAHTRMLDALALHTFTMAAREPHHLRQHVSTDIISFEGIQLNMVLDSMTQGELRHVLPADLVAGCTDDRTGSDLYCEIEDGDARTTEELVADSIFERFKNHSTRTVVTELRLDGDKEKPSSQSLHHMDDKIPRSADHKRAWQLSNRRSGHSSRGNHLYPHPKNMEL
jgi:hypothetical protein